MVTSFSHSFQSEWIKKRNTASSWMILIAALFMPILVLTIRSVSFESAKQEVVSPHFWQIIHYRNWVAMGMFLLPLTVILFTSLVASIEFRNNTWKLVHTLPQYFSTVFFSKLAVVIVMLIQLLFLFNIGIYLSAIVPSLIFKDVSFPSESFPWKSYLTSSFFFFLDCLPVVALQYLLSLHFKNFLVSIGIGFGLLIISLLALNWKYGYLVPYIYLPLSFKENQNYVDSQVNRHSCAIIYFVILTASSYLFYIFKKDKA